VITNVQSHNATDSAKRHSLAAADKPIFISLPINYVISCRRDHRQSKIRAEFVVIN